MEEIDYKMYCFVFSQLTHVQKGIKALHAVLEYAKEYGDTEEYKKWREMSKPIVILEGGIIPEITEVMRELSSYNIKCSGFIDDDFGGNSSSCFAVLADERVYNTEKYPDFDVWRDRKYPVREMHCVAWVGGDFDHDPNDYTWTRHHKEWLSDVIGGEGNEFLRKLIKSRKIVG